MGYLGIREEIALLRMHFYSDENNLKITLDMLRKKKTDAGLKTLLLNIVRVHLLIISEWVNSHFNFIKFKCSSTETLKLYR